MVDPLFQVKQSQQIGGFLFDFVSFAPCNIAGDAYILESGKLGKQMVELKNKANLFIAKSGELFFVQGKNIGIVDDNLARVGAPKVPRIWSSVVLPAPLAPTMATISPFRTSSETPFKTLSSPNDFVTCSAFSIER